MDVSDYSLRRCGDRLFHNRIEVEAAGGKKCPSEGNRFALGGGPFAGSWLLLWGQSFLERLFEDGFDKGDFLASGLNSQ